MAFDRETKLNRHHNALCMEKYLYIYILYIAYFKRHNSCLEKVGMIYFWQAVCTCVHVCVCVKDFPIHSLLAMQCSVGNSLFRNSPCSTELTEGLCTSWRVNLWDCVGVCMRGRGSYTVHIYKYMYVHKYRNISKSWTISLQTVVL